MQPQAHQLALPIPPQRSRCAAAVALAHVLCVQKPARAKQAANLPVEPHPELPLPAPSTTRVRSAASILLEHELRLQAEPEVILIVAPAAPLPEGAQLNIALGDPEFENCEPIPPDQQHLGEHLDADPGVELPYWVGK